jgi:hypothetical protein
MGATLNITGAMAENSPEAQQGKQAPPSTLSSVHQSEQSQNVSESKYEANPGSLSLSGQPGGSGGPGDGRPIVPGMAPPVEYPKGLKLYSIIIPLYFTAFLTALVCYFLPGSLFQSHCLIIDLP